MFYLQVNRSFLFFLPIILLLLLPCLDYVGARICFEELDVCSHCNDTHAQCRTRSADGIIPQNLSRNTYHLVVNHIGQSKELTQSMFNRYPRLEYLILLGNISSVCTNTFAGLKYLKHLTLTETYITEFPAELFHHDNRLTSLKLHNNRLTEIPLESLRQLPYLEILNLAYNNIWHPDCLTIGHSFHNLKKLISLNLANLTVNHTCSEQIPSTFFETIQDKVVQLNLTKTNVYNGDKRITSNFSKLSTLDLSRVEDFEKCPGSAKYLFLHLPLSLERLVMRRWSPFTLDSHCVLTASNIAGLKSLPKLREIDVKYSDLMFGYALTREVFNGFVSLENLNLEWCRFVNIDDNVFAGTQRLRWLSMKGNPIGNRAFAVAYDENGSRSRCQLKSLNLARAALFSDPDNDFHLYKIINSCQIQEVDLTGNLLRHMPILSKTYAVSPGGIFLQSVILDHNYLENLQMHFGLALSSFCFYVNNLHHLSLRMNRLVDIRGLCLSLTHLYLNGNKRLKENWEVNEAELSKLSLLEVLDLSENDIDEISSGTFKSMRHLREIYLRMNNITSLSANLFLKNENLTLIDLSFNRLRDIQAVHISHLKSLRTLDLQNNQILHLDITLIEFFEQAKALQFLRLRDNPLSCRCEDQHTQDFLRKTNKVASAQTLTCSGPKLEHGGEKVFQYHRNAFYCDHRDNIIIAFSVLGGFLATLLVALPCYKYRWYLTHSKTVFAALISRIREVRFHYKCVYDAIIIYNYESEEDCDFVANHLSKSVEEESDGDNNKEVCYSLLKSLNTFGLTYCCCILSCLMFDKT